ncbi:hypothetical protein ACIBJI_13350 [Nocardia sp. NPDC050408]|uniref:hypothetical protein n=1 Tax=Nocardia sp. NPDC050408 TaxID=3364319 RepID=UPI0037A4B9AA
MPRPFMWRVSVSTALPVYRHSPRAGIGHWPLLIALADHFRQAPWYLTDPGDAQRVIDTYSQLDLLRALREASVQRVRSGTGSAVNPSTAMWATAASVRTVRASCSLTSSAAGPHGFPTRNQLNLPITTRRVRSVRD